MNLLIPLLQVFSNTQNLTDVSPLTFAVKMEDTINVVYSVNITPENAS